jgi:amino acid transporter
MAPPHAPPPPPNRPPETPPPHTPADPTPGTDSHTPTHQLPRQLNLRDLVLSQILSVVGSAWVGIAAGLGRAQTLVWILAMLAFYLPMAACVFYLNREMPLEGGLYVWARRAFGDTTGFLVAFNIWAYGLATIATIFSQLPTEFAYMAGPRFAWIPENHLVVLSTLAILLALLAFTAVRGLALGKWVHNVSGAAMLLAFALLIVSPFWAMLHHVPIHYAPLAIHLPKANLTSLALIGQVLFAASGLEYVAIMAGETHSPSRLIGRSILIASPLIVLMFILGTGSVLAFHQLHPNIPINYIAPIPQTLVLAFGSRGLGAILARLTILLLQVRILGAASFLFTGVTRLPMAAGWDHLIPDRFARLNPRFRTPTNSILLGVVLIAALLVLAFAGVHAAEAFAILNNASSELYQLAYLAMFLIPIVGARLVRQRLPRWLAWLSGLGVLTTIFCTVIAAYPFLEVPNPLAFALKIVATVLLVNLFGYAFYRLRHRPTPTLLS